MEEILASIRRIISDDQPAPVEASKPVSIVPPMADVEPSMSEEEDVLDLTTPVQIAPPTPQPVAVVEHAQPQAPPPPPAPSQAIQPAHSAMTETHDMLLSQTADAAVSQSFGSLAHTVLTQNARTIDDVVKDMLRPMLKSWLDDNLPVIVERLVRAEIERVARGGR